MAHRRGRRGCRARPSAKARGDRRPSAAITTRAGRVCAPPGPWTETPSTRLRPSAPSTSGDITRAPSSTSRRRDWPLRGDRVEIATPDRGPHDAAGINGADGGSAGPGDQHSCDRQSLRLDLARQPVSRQQRHRPRVHRVAAQLVAWEHRPIEDRHASPCAREHQRGNCASRSPANERMSGIAPRCRVPVQGQLKVRARVRVGVPAVATVKPWTAVRRHRHHYIAPSTIALFFDPNPRQLQSAAAGRAAFPSRGR